MIRKLYNISLKLIIKIRWIYFTLLFKEYGNGSRIQGRVYISNPEFIFIGKKTSIGPFCRLETFPNYGKVRTTPKLFIGDNCSIQHAVHIYCAKSVIIDSGCLIASGCMITDENHGMNPSLGYYASQPLDYSPTHLKEGVWLGENVSVLPGVTIGKFSIVGSNSVVKHDIPDYSIAIGSPAKVIKRYNFESKNWEKL
jgi:acetyltransferase-like isoleucine patch superfamily enzyme